MLSSASRPSGHAWWSPRLVEAEATAANPEQGCWQGRQDAQNSCEGVFKGPTVTMPAVARGHPWMTPQLLPSSPVWIAQPPEKACYNWIQSNKRESPHLPLQASRHSRVLGGAISGSHLRAPVKKRPNLADQSTSSPGGQSHLRADIFNKKVIRLHLRDPEPDLLGRPGPT
uniref:Uncharacterized protein n=1 Tax=Rangifer tarandus platyrhynchus TaxID=3082113 RepID=A0ACB0FF39_RANTA|nr:unnamed protein product [Rangifer tarandus platyrhynchus]